MPGKEIAVSPTNLFDVAVDLEEMGRRMESARETAGLTVSQLSFRTEIGETLVRRYLRGETEPGATRLARIAKVLAVNADWLLQNTDNPQPVSDLWDGKSERRANPPASGGAPFEELDTPAVKQPRRRRSA